MATVIVITAVAKTKDPIQQTTKLNITYNQTAPNDNELPCELQVSETGDPYTWSKAALANTVAGTGKVTTVIATFRDGQPLYLRLVSEGATDGADPTNKAKNTGLVISNTFNAGFAPAA